MTANQKIRYYYELSEQTAQKAVSNRAEWMKLLDTSAKMYKYTFLEQLLIHNQKPDSIACAQIEMWNKSFDRWVNRGTKGIAIIDETGTQPRLRHIFDVSDTHAYSKNAPTVNLWELKEEHLSSVLAKLADIYDDIDPEVIAESDSISEIFHNIANQMATEYYNDNSQEIRYRVENSFLEGLDDDNLRVAFTDSVSSSIAYVLMSRCGYDVSEYFTEEDFDHISSFNTSDMIHLLGETTRDLSAQVLRDVELVVKKYERQKSNERLQSRQVQQQQVLQQNQELNQNNQLTQNQNLSKERNVDNEAENQSNAGRTDLRSTARPEPSTDISGGNGIGVHSSGGLSSSEHSIGERGRETVGQIRNDAEELSEGTPQNNTQYAIKSRETVPTLQGNRGTGGSEIITSNDGSNSQSEPTQQRNRPDGLDSGNEYAETSSGGTDSSRTDLRLHLSSNELPQPTGNLLKSLSTSSITIDEVDSILRDGGNDHHSLLRISAQLAKDMPLEDNADYMRQEYLKGRYKYQRIIEGGKGFQFGTKELSVWFDRDALTIGRGKSAQTARDFIKLDWEQVAERMKQLYDTGHFVNHDILEEALHREHIEMSESLLNLYRDDFRDFREVPESWGRSKKGWPDTVEHVTGLLKDKDEYQTILENLTADIAELEANPQVRTYYYHDAQLTLSDLEKLGIEPKGFPVAEIRNINSMRFITNDEIDSYLRRGSVVSEGKMRILSHFLHKHTPKENVAFLKNEYGHGGGTWGKIDGGFHEAEPSKGVRLRRRGCEDVNMRWEAVSKRIDELVKNGRYASPAELAQIPQYEKIILALQINDFFGELPDEKQYRSPFSKELNFYYPRQADFEALNTFMENAPTAEGIQPIDDCLEKMQYIFDNTSVEDRDYDLRKTVIEDLTAFRDGKYTLFPDIDRIKAGNEQTKNNDISSNTSLLSTPFPDVLPVQNSAHQMSLFVSESFPQLPTVNEQQAIIERKNVTIKQSEILEIPKNAPMTEQPVTDLSGVTTNINESPISEDFSETDDATEIPVDLDTNFDDIAEWFLESVLNDNTYLEEMSLAKSRSSLRNACSAVLESVINDYEHEWTEVYQAFHNDDDFNDRIFDYVLRKSWEHQQTLEAESTIDIVTKVDDEVSTEISEEVISRFEVSVTSDAYDESEPYAIWDNETESSYFDESGDIPTFETEEEAQAFLVELQNKHAGIETLQDEQSTKVPTQSPYTTSWDKFVDIVKSDSDNVANYTEPIVLIENSESSHFNDKERLTFAVADQKIKVAEAEIWAEREEKPTGYKKTNGTIFYKDNPDDTELSTYSFRYDLGDYQGEQSGLYNFLKMYRQNVEEAFNRGDGTTKAMNVTPESIAAGKRMLEILGKSLNTEKSIDVETANAVPSKSNMPITKAVINSFSGTDRLLYAKDGEGSVYISNSLYIMKIAESDLSYLTKQVNGRRRKDFIEPTETPVLLEYINKVQGNFELTSTPHEMDDPRNNNLKTLVYADNKQYFCYDKKFVEMFMASEQGENIANTSNVFQTKLFVNDNSSYDIENHNLIVKDQQSGVIGLILPARVPERLYTQLADILPLEIPYKNEIERAKENPTHDPYIGREFFDGKETHFVSRIINVNDNEKYLVPNITYDKDGGNPSLSRYALHIDKNDMDNQIKRWEDSRLYVEQEKAINAEQVQQEIIEKAIYENTNGYADNLPQLQKARVLNVLNNYFHTKDYGNIRLKEFVEMAIKNGSNLKIATPMKKKYREMEATDYFDEVRGFGARNDIEMRSNYNKASHSHDPESANAQWLKTEHPFLYYDIFHDESILDNSFFNTEYRLYLDESRFYEISKIAYDYGSYIVDNGVLDKQVVSADSKESTTKEEIETQNDISYPDSIGENAVLRIFYDNGGKDEALAHKLNDAFERSKLDRYSENIFKQRQIKRSLFEVLNNNEQTDLIFDLILTYEKQSTLGQSSEKTEMTTSDIELSNESLEEKIRNELSNRGYAVSDELIADGIEEYGENEDFHDIASYIENNYLIDETEIDKTLLTGNTESTIDKTANAETTNKSEKLQEIQESPRYTVKTVVQVEQISSDPNVVSLLPKNDNGVRYGIYDNQISGYLKKDDEAYVVFPTEKEATDYAEKLNAGLVPDISNDTPKLSIPPNAPKPPNFRITDDNLGHGGIKAKYATNIEAIKTLQAIEAENRYATRSEQEILSRYVGWGGIQEAFDETKTQWANEYAELETLLTPVEYKSAKSSVLNAHYTSPTVIKAIYDTIERMGFKSGNVLEPSVGVGNFLGLLPDSMNAAKLYGVEIDSVSARIAKQLYPNATIKEMGYEKTDYPDSFFDIALGNVPFGDYGVVDKKYDKHKLKIHDYFFAKSLDQIRPGGIVAFVTSKGTLDKQNSDVRKYLAQRAELLGAVRLPMTAFKANAGTEVTTDIIFLQKRDRIIDVEPDWIHLGQIEDAGNPENKISVNRYFVDNPEMILGQMSTESGIRMYGSVKSASCIPFETMPDGSPAPSLAEQLQKAMLNIQGQITTPEVSVDIDDLGDSNLEAIPADPDVRNFSFTVANETVYFRENSMMYPVDQPATTLERIKGMVQLRDCVRELIALQVDERNMWGKNGEFDGGENVERLIKNKQAELDTLYNKFNKEFGRINASANSRAFATGQFSDNSYYLLCSLEVFDEEGNFKRKGDMFTKRTIKPKTVITHVDTSTEALAVSMGEKAEVNIEYMSQLTGFTPEKIIQDLSGVIYCDITNPIRTNEPFSPDKMKIYEKYPLVTADEFLSGNIRKKLERARDFQEAVGNEFHGIDVSFTVKSLEGAMPKDLEAHEINLRLGSTWISPDYVQQFMYETLQTSWHNKDIYQVKYHSGTGEWNITGKGKALFGDIPSTVTYGTKRANAYQILDDTLNLKDVRVYDYKTDENGNQVRELNKKETTLAQQKQEQLKQMFKDWIFKDPERRENLVKLYNEKFNSTRPREYDGSHITFSGISPEIKLRPHQLNAIAHILYGGNTLLAHEVGAGKTFEIVAATMESKRLGLTNKSLVAVPNHLTEQWGSEWLRLYPSANILVATKKDFEPRNRKKFIAKIATGEYDAIIIGHTQLEKIPLSVERQQRILNEQIDEIADGIREVKDTKGDNFTIKQMERTKKNLEVKLQKLVTGKKKDNVITFEELGCDKLYIDESHSFKNLMLVSKMRNVAGLSTSDAQKSTDLFMKTRYMDELTTNLHGRPCGTVFASGTPISNSIAELYTVQRYLQYDLLMDKDFSHFDSWASTFCEPQTTIELAPDNSGYRARTRLSTFHNLPELMAMFKDVADVQTADTLNLPVPKANYETIVAEPSDLQKEMVENLSERASLVQRKAVDARVDNMLKITTDGRKIGLDQRLMNGMLPDFEGSKINMCADNVMRIWKETKPEKLTQLVFCDFSTPNKDGRFNVYEDIRAKLFEKGIPEHEVAFIHDYNTESQKKELFAKVRKGKVRVLFGSTAKMGAGTNVQDKLIAIHDVDCPWRPADLEQRRGRIVRQGNTNDEVNIYRYATSKTFDSYLWQTVEAKQKFISQIMTSKSPVRSCEDVDETALSYAEIKALCAGNPLIAEKMKLDIDVAKLRMGKAEYQSQHYRLEDNLLKKFPKEIASANERIAGIEADIKLYEKHNINTVAIQAQNSLGGENVGAVSVSAKFAGMVINGVTYNEKEPAGKALLDACTMIVSTDVPDLGEYMGFKMSLTFESYSKGFKLHLKGSITHTIDLGTDTFGNISRINNELSNLPAKLEAAKSNLAEILAQEQAAKDELTKPFYLADELNEKELRLAELNTELNLDVEKNTVETVEATDSRDTENIVDIKHSQQMGKTEFIRNVGEFNTGKRTDFGGDVPIKRKDELAI